MRFPSPLQRGRLLIRYKRFLADIELENGETVTAHCTQPGTMMGLTEPGNRVWVSESDNPKRKLKFSWELVEVDLGNGPVMVGVNTGLPNKLAAETIRGGAIKELTGYSELRREVAYGTNSRVDILLEENGIKSCYLEIKNVGLMREHGRAEFPDAVTTRGTKHLGELSAMVREGNRAMLLYVVQREDAEHFVVARDIDPDYGQAFDEARAAGVEALAYACTLSDEEIVIRGRIPIED